MLEKFDTFLYGTQIGLDDHVKLSFTLRGISFQF